MEVALILAAVVATAMAPTLVDVAGKFTASVAPELVVAAAAVAMAMTTTWESATAAVAALMVPTIVAPAAAQRLALAASGHGSGSGVNSGKHVVRKNILLEGFEFATFASKK